MRVYLIAHTVIDRPEIHDASSGRWAPDPYATDADSLGEFAGRSCYLSWDRPNPKTAGNGDYLAHIIAQQHFSVLAHASATFYVTGVSRALTHEMIRSRFLAFSEVSQRYVDAGRLDVVVPPAMLGDLGLLSELARVSSVSAGAYENIVTALLERGISRKQAREAARAVLPSAVETRIVVTGNLRAWRDYLLQRMPEGVDAEHRELAHLIRAELVRIAPNSFQDITEDR